MPAGKLYVATRRRKRRRRKQKRSRKPSGLSTSTVVVPRYNSVRSMRVGLPNSFRTLMRYVDTFTLNPGAGLISSQVMRANGVFDPDFTGGGHQPLGFDEFIGAAGLYNHFHVMNSKIVIQPIVAASNSSSTVCLTLTDVNAGLTAFNDIMEQANCAYVSITGQDTASKNILRGSFNSKKFFRRGSNQISLIGTAAADPSEQAYWVIQYFNHLPSGDADAVNIRVQVTYDVLCTEPRLLTGS